MNNLIPQEAFEEISECPERKDKRPYIQPRIILEYDLETRAGSPLPGINPDTFPFNFP